MRGFSCKLQGRLLGRCLLHPSTSPVQFISQHVLLYFEFTLLGFKSFYHFYHFYPIRSFLQVSILLFQVSHRFLATFEIISSLFKHALSQLHRIPSFLNSHSTCLLNQSIVHTFTRTTGAHTHTQSFVDKASGSNADVFHDWILLSIQVVTLAPQNQWLGFEHSTIAEISQQILL